MCFLYSANNIISVYLLYVYTCYWHVCLNYEINLCIHIFMASYFFVDIMLVSIYHKYGRFYLCTQKEKYVNFQSILQTVLIYLSWVWNIIDNYGKNSFQVEQIVKIHNVEVNATIVIFYKTH